MHCFAVLAVGIVGFAHSLQPAFSQALSGDASAGQKLARQCRVCHGMDGYAAIPIAPHIGGEPAAYLAGQLKAFRDGAREHEMMSVVTRGLSDQAIADLAAWYGAQQATARVPEAMAAPETLATCAACHGADGIATQQDAPNLAGESALYIDTQLKAFREGKRRHEVMSELTATLSDSEIRALADWYAGITLTINEAE